MCKIPSPSQGKNHRHSENLRTKKLPSITWKQKAKQRDKNRPLLTYQHMRRPFTGAEPVGHYWGFPVRSALLSPFPHSFPAAIPPPATLFELPKGVLFSIIGLKDSIFCIIAHFFRFVNRGDGFFGRGVQVGPFPRGGAAGRPPPRSGAGGAFSGENAEGGRWARLHFL